MGAVLAIGATPVLHIRRLKVYLPQDRKWKERYHANMFDAVALAIVAAGVDERVTR